MVAAVFRGASKVGHNSNVVELVWSETRFDECVFSATAEHEI